MERAADSKNGAAPESRVIPYPEQYSARLREAGVPAPAGKPSGPDARYYVMNDYFNMESDETLHILTHFQTYQQTTGYTCGAACALMVLNWFGRKKYHEMLIGELIDVIPETGASVECIADLFDLIGFDVDFHADTSLRFQKPEDFERYVIDCIDKRTPILVDWVDWAGHWQVIIGIDTCGTETPYDDVLIFADPYDITKHSRNGYFTFPLVRFFHMWREGPCANKAEPYRQPFVAARPKDLSASPFGVDAESTAEDGGKCGAPGEDRLPDLISDGEVMRSMKTDEGPPAFRAENPYMRAAINEALDGITRGHGGPFGSVIVRDGEVVGRGHNRVLADHDPSAHGEIQALRDAGRRLGTHDLSGCTLYTTGEPCTMCLCACLWARIDKVYYGCDIADNARIGFRDGEFDALFGGRDALGGYLERLDRDACLELFDAYLKMDRTLY